MLIAVVLLNNSIKYPAGQKLCNLSENIFPLVHNLKV